MARAKPRDRSWNPRMQRAYPDRQRELRDNREDRELPARIDALEAEVRELIRAHDALFETVLELCTSRVGRCA